MKTSRTLLIAMFAIGFEGSLRAQNTDRSVILAQPYQLEVPNFLSDIDKTFMSDELMQNLEASYSQRLKELSFRSGFYSPSRDTLLARPFVGSQEDEQKLREAMALSMRHYMLTRGIPRFLSSRESTKNIGENYQAAMNIAQNTTRLEMQQEGSPWKFSAGINPFTTRAWVRYYSDQWNFENWERFATSNPVDQGASVVSYRWLRYVAQGSYFYHADRVQPLFKIQHRGNLWTEYKISIPTNTPNFVNESVTLLGLGYTF